MIETILKFAKNNILEIMLSIATVYAILTGKNEATKELRKMNKTRKTIKKLEEKQEKTKQKAMSRQKRINELNNEVEKNVTNN